MSVRAGNVRRPCTDGCWAAVLGVGGHPVTVEAHVGRGLPTLIVTGLPGAAVQDARERVRPAVEGAELEWPLRRVVVNLAPANPEGGTGSTCRSR